MLPIQIDVYQPPAGHPLEGSVLSIFRCRAETPYRHETILPKGNVDLLFNLGAPVHGAGLRPEPYIVTEGSAWIGGLKTRPYSVHPQAAMDLVGISLRADACAGLLPLSPGEIINVEVHGIVADAELATITEQLYEIPSFDDQSAFLMRWLMRRLRPVRGADLVRHACALLRRSRAEDAVRETARTMAVSPRHLRRLMDQHVGVGPAEYVRLSRFIDSLHRMASPRRTLTEIALSAGYFDQAHFCRDFRSFAGMTPQEYRAQAGGPVVGHIFRE